MRDCCQEYVVPTDDTHEHVGVLHVALAGNPNAGKSTIFNALTGARQHTGNWPGKTVERREGQFSLNGGRPEREVRVVDLPGTYSLSAYSSEEVIAMDYLLDANSDVVVIVVDASNLERNLYLTTQVLEMGLPVVVALNMMDTAQSRGLRIDMDRLSEGLGSVPVVPMVARRDEGLEDLKDQIALAKSGTLTCDCAGGRHRVGCQLVDYGPMIEPHINALATCIEQLPSLASRYSPRWLAIKLLEDDEHVLERLNGLDAHDLLAGAEHARSEIGSAGGDDADILITDRRYGYINGLVREVVERSALDRRTRSDRIDSVVTHPLWGLPIFAAAMFVVFQMTANVSAHYIDWIDALISGPLSRWASWLLGVIGLGGTWVESLLIDGAIAGVGGVLVFVPVLVFTYFFIAVLEDSGYMARAAFLMDRFMHRIGLHGKSFIPMLLGFGCNVPGVYAARTLDSEKDRLLTALLVPFMSCGARLPVYMVIGAAFFGVQAGLLVFAMYVLGIVAAVGVGLLLKHTLFRVKEQAPFVIELPPYRLPTARSVFLRTYEHTKAFVENATSVILIASLVVWLLLAIPVRGGTFANVATGDSALASVSRWMAPAFEPAGYGEWQAASSLVTGFVAKEVIVSTLSVVYVGPEPDTGEGAAPTFGQDLIEIGRSFALATWDTVRGTISMLPGVNLLGDADTDEMDAGLVNALRGAFSPLGAVAFCVFVLLTAPCFATMAALRHEFGTKWMLFSAGLMLAVAWVASVLVYQGGTLLGLG